MEYEKTQYGPWPWIILPIGVGIPMLSAFLHRPFELGEVLLVSGIAALFILLALTFCSMTIRDEGDCLLVYLGYNILPFHKRIRYSDIKTAERGRSSIIDGWGIHYIPFRGWTFNIWGFNCLKLTMKNGKVIRIGSDDVENLTVFLRGKIQNGLGK